MYWEKKIIYENEEEKKHYAKEKKSYKFLKIILLWKWKMIKPSLSFSYSF